MIYWGPRIAPLPKIPVIRLSRLLVQQIELFPIIISPHTKTGVFAFTTRDLNRLEPPFSKFELGNGHFPVSERGLTI